MMIEETKKMRYIPTRDETVISLDTKIVKHFGFEPGKDHVKIEYDEHKIIITKM